MKRQIRLLSTAPALLGMTLLSGCQSSPAANNGHDALQRPHWEYSGDHGPEHWADLSEEFSLCAAGRLQSPFNIEADISANLPDLSLDYSSVAMKVINNGHTIQVDQSGAGQLSVGGKSFDLLQFHFHSGSEYTIDGEAYPLEIHLVHASGDGELAVVGVMVKEGAANTELARIWANMPASKGENIVVGQTINVSNLLPVNNRYYRFMGSLTTPPCSEGVNWHMMSEPITASAEQITAFKAIYPMNARPLQEENNRLVVFSH
jgi:carbonic anhydrase